MKGKYAEINLFYIVLMLIGCKKNEQTSIKTVVTTEFHNVFKSLAIFKHEGYSVVKFQTLGLKQIRTSLISKEKNGSIPDSLQKYTTISVPLQTIVVTSTTIFLLEMLR
jgi:iron complex transport system substrate-binding protein